LTGFDIKIKNVRVRVSKENK